MAVVFWTGLLVLTSGVVLGDVSAPYPPAPVPSNGAPIPYVQQYSSPYGQPPSFGVQTGYDGYVVSTPELIETEDEGEDEEEEEEAGGILDFFKELAEELGLKGEEQEDEEESEGHSIFKKPAALLLFPLLKKLFWPFSLIFKFGLRLFAPLSYLLLGGALTAGTCIFTPFCTLSVLGLGLKRENVRSLITQDRLSSISNFVNEAITKFQELQKKVTRRGRKMRKLSRNSSKDDDQEITPLEDNSLDTSTRKTGLERK